MQTGRTVHQHGRAISFRAATHSGVFSLLPMHTGEGRAHHGAILREATRLAETGDLVPRIDRRHCDFDSMAEAHEAVESRNVTGKIAIDIGEPTTRRDRAAAVPVRE